MIEEVMSDVEVLPEDNGENHGDSPVGASFLPQDLNLLKLRRCLRRCLRRPCRLRAS